MKFNELLEMVAEFNAAADLPHSKEITLLSDRESQLRLNLMREENLEYYDATLIEDIEGVADALADQLYILLGTIGRHGLGEKMTELIKEVHRSNMSKLTNGKMIKNENGKVIKPPHYSKPNLKPILFDTIQEKDYDVNYTN